MRKPLWVTAACVAAATLTGNAFADETGYLCNLSYYPGSTSAGSYGFISTYITANPDCTLPGGDILYYLCSTNASNNKCSSSAPFRATTAAQMATMAEQAAIAAASHAKVTIVAASGCLGTGNNLCAQYIKYY